MNFERTKPLTLSSCSFRSLAMVSSAVLFASSSSVQLLRTSDRSLLRTTIYRNNQHAVKHVTFCTNLQSRSNVRNGDPRITRDFSNAKLSVRSGSPLFDPSFTDLFDHPVRPWGRKFESGQALVQQSIQRMTERLQYGHNMSQKMSHLTFGMVLPGLCTTLVTTSCSSVP